MIPKIIQHVQQVDKKSCVHACIAMVTGNPIEDILSAFPRPGTMSNVGIYLAKNGIWMIPRSSVTPMNYGFVYIIDTPSRNHLGLVHSIVLDLRDSDTPLCFDPQKGREGKEFYTVEGFFTEEDEPTCWSSHFQLEDIYT